jgi:uncharacterized protein with HEPN domain
MSKTAIQQMMNELNELHPNLLNVQTKGGREFVQTCHKYLSIEKQNIIDAVNNTIKNIKLDEDKTGFISQNGEGYFIETFGGNK